MSASTNYNHATDAPPLPTLAELAAEYPDGLSPHGAAALAEYHGLDEITAHWLFALRGPVVAVASWRSTVAHCLRLADRAGRRAELRERLEGLRAVAAEFVAPDGWRYIAHPSSRRPGWYQLSRIDSRGPVGHSEHADLLEAAAAACCCSERGPLHDYGDSDCALAAVALASGSVIRV